VDGGDSVKVQRDLVGESVYKWVGCPMIFYQGCLVKVHIDPRKIRATFRIPKGMWCTHQENTVVEDEGS